jgi:hypothetical protein
MLAPISPIDLVHILTECTILDTRPIELFKSGHLPGSIMINASLVKSSSGISTGLIIELESSKYIILISGEEIDSYGTLLLSIKQSHVMAFDEAEIGDLSIIPCACQPQFYGNACQSKCLTLL